MFTLYADGGIIEAHDTEAQALASARNQNCEAFEIRDDELDVQVHVEYPRALHLAY